VRFRGTAQGQKESRGRCRGPAGGKYSAAAASTGWLGESPPNRGPVCATGVRERSAPPRRPGPGRAAGHGGRARLLAAVSRQRTTVRDGGAADFSPGFARPPSRRLLFEAPASRPETDRIGRGPADVQIVGRAPRNDPQRPLLAGNRRQRTGRTSEAATARGKLSESTARKVAGPAVRSSPRRRTSTLLTIRQAPRRKPSYLSPGGACRKSRRPVGLVLRPRNQPGNLCERPHGRARRQVEGA